MGEWKDESNFSRGQVDRTPTVWRRYAGAFRLSVHRHIYYDPTDWLFTCEPVAQEVVLRSKTATDAQKEADKIFTKALKKALE